MKNAVPFSAYMHLPLMSVMGFAIASLVFKLILNDPSPIPVFIIFGTIQLTCMSLFAFLPIKGKTIVRNISKFLIGSFIFLLAGILGRNNFQLEGLFFYLLSGTFSGVIVHFMMGKILGPVFFSRSWCSWGCWTAMILDLLPYKDSHSWKKGLDRFRFIHFILSLILVAILFFGFKYSFIQTDTTLLKKGMGTLNEMLWFLTGNLLYFAIGISLAITLKDNRAFCKYLCPITIFFKTLNRITLLRIKGNQNKCSNCGECAKKCPMRINIPKYIKTNERVKSTECIMCLECIANCPKGVLSTSLGFDYAKSEYLN